jgi:hypothetical protein
VNSDLATHGFALIDGVHATDAQLSSYEQCPHDPFMGNGTRYKRFSQYKLTHDENSWTSELLPRRAYTAPKKFNPIGGGYKRPYEPLQADFTGIVAFLADQLGLDTSVAWQINVHQNRSIADSERNGQLTPEGRHKDGHEFVSISMFDRIGVTGGRTRVWASEDAEDPLFEHTMVAGQTLLLDDRAVLHDVTDIEPEGNTRGTRDILIVAYSRWDERWYGDAHDAAALDTGDVVVGM